MTKKKVIAQSLNKWIYRLGLRWWTVNVYWYKKPKQVKRFFGKRKDETVLARTFSDWRYGTAEIHFNLPAFECMTDDEIESVIIHELCHVLVNEMREGEIHHEERVVTQLQKAFCWTVADAKGDGN
jgi:predicted SprT family Zn-dependent metalloprotease